MGYSPMLPPNMIIWSRKFAFFPHICDSTGHLIWLTYAYRSSSRLAEFPWVSTDAFLIKQLKGEV